MAKKETRRVRRLRKAKEGLLDARRKLGKAEHAHKRAYRRYCDAFSRDWE